MAVHRPCAAEDADVAGENIGQRRQSRELSEGNAKSLMVICTAEASCGTVIEGSTG